MLGINVFLNTLSQLYSKLGHFLFTRSVNFIIYSFIFIYFVYKRGSDITNMKIQETLSGAKLAQPQTQTRSQPQNGGCAATLWPSQRKTVFISDFYKVKAKLTQLICCISSSTNNESNQISNLVCYLSFSKIYRQICSRDVLLA